MPRNRQQIPREERVDELLAAATKLFLTNGYDRTTMSDISAAAGVARANVYWYYPSKDDIFAAVMDRMLTQDTQAIDHEMRDLNPLSVLVRGLASMRSFRGLHQGMHDRMEHSPVTRAAHDRFLDWIRSLVDAVLDQHPGHADRTMIADVAITIFEGANVSEPPLRPAHEMISFFFQSVLGLEVEPIPTSLADDRSSSVDPSASAANEVE